MAKVPGGCIARGGPVCLMLVSISNSSNIDLGLVTFVICIQHVLICVSQCKFVCDWRKFAVSISWLPGRIRC